MAKSFDKDILFSVRQKLDQLTINKNRNLKDSNDKVTILLNELIVCFHERKNESNPSAIDAQEIVDIALKFIAIVNPNDSFKIAKVAHVWSYVSQLPSVTLTISTSEQLLNWISKSLNEADDLVLIDILNCLAAIVLIKEVKLAKGLESIIGSTSVLSKRIGEKTNTDLNVCYLKILCNFTHCPGEKDWSSISKNLIETCILRLTSTLESNLNSDISNLNILRALVFAFHGLENIFVRFHTLATVHLSSIFGLAKCYILFGIAGHFVKYSPIVPSSVPFFETFSMKTEKTPTLRKKRPPSKTQTKTRTATNTQDEEESQASSSQQKAVKSWKSSSAAFSSDSELSDSDGFSLVQLKKVQAKVRCCALKMLSAAFKFCEQRVITSYWSAFLPDSSQNHIFRQSLITPILKDSSVKVRCNALVALSNLLQAIQPTLTMASYQENRTGAFIPFSQTLAETVVAVQRSLLLSLSAEQSIEALIQIFKCLAVAASVFPFEKLPQELVVKTVQQCKPFLDFKDSDVKVACLSVMRVLICAQSAHSDVLQVFKSSEKKCWLFEHCLALIDNIDGQSVFPLTLESLLLVGEVTRSNIQLSQPYLHQIVHSICRKLLADHDSGVQIRSAKALALVCSSILQEMDKEEHEQIISREEAVELWTHILRHGIAEVLQHAAIISPLRAEACAALATIGSMIFECLPRELRILFATLALGCASDADPSVRAAAVRTIGFAVTFNTLNDDASFLLDSSEQILVLLRDSNVLVSLNASWALGNLADSLEKDKNSLLDELPRDFLLNLIRAAVLAAQGPMKVRCNGIRALGIFLKIVVDIPAEGSDTAVLLDQAISIVTKQATSGNFMKNRWNACYACGNVLQNVALLTAFSHWMDKLMDSILLVFRNCSNFKVRISAANALLYLNHRQILGNHFSRLWLALLDSLATSEQIDDFSEFQHHETMCRSICNTMCKLITLMTKEDLSQLHEVIMKYYDVCSANFSKFLKSLLPEQLELVIEASNYVRLLKQSSGLLSSQTTTLELFQDLLIIPI